MFLRITQNQTLTPVGSLGSGQLSVQANIAFSKRYIKYLTKKFLKKNMMREWLRCVQSFPPLFPVLTRCAYSVVATSPTTYTLKFYNIAFDGAEDEA